MKKDDGEGKIIKGRVVLAVVVFIYLIVAWSCIISLMIKVVGMVGIMETQDKIYFLIGFISGLLCSLMAIHKQDMEDLLKGKIQ